MKALIIACLCMFLAPPSTSVMLDDGERYQLDQKIEYVKTGVPGSP